MECQTDGCEDEATQTAPVERNGSCWTMEMCDGCAAAEEIQGD
jgi:hypothetical protein